MHIWVHKLGIKHLLCNQCIRTCNSLVDFVIVLLFFARLLQQLKLMGLNRHRRTHTHSDLLGRDPPDSLQITITHIFIACACGHPKHSQDLGDHAHRPKSLGTLLHARILPPQSWSNPVQILPDRYQNDEWLLSSHYHGHYGHLCYHEHVCTSINSNLFHTALSHPPT